MHGIDVYSPLSSLPLLMSQEGQDFYRGWAGEGAPPTGNIVPVWNYPGIKPTGLVQDRKQVKQLLDPCIQADWLEAT